MVMPNVVIIFQPFNDTLESNIGITGYMFSMAILKQIMGYLKVTGFFKILPSIEVSFLLSCHSI